MGLTINHNEDVVYAGNKDTVKCLMCNESSIDGLRETSEMSAF